MFRHLRHFDSSSSGHPNRLMFHTEVYDGMAQHAGSEVIAMHGLANKMTDHVPTHLSANELPVSLRPHDVAEVWREYATAAGMPDANAPDIFVKNHDDGILWIDATGKIIRTNDAMERIFQKTFGGIIQPVYPENYDSNITITRAAVDAAMAQYGIAKNDNYHVFVTDGQITQRTTEKEVLDLFDMRIHKNGEIYATLRNSNTSPTFQIVEEQYGELTELRIKEVFNPRDLLHFDARKFSPALQESARRLQEMHNTEAQNDEIPLTSSDVSSIAETSMDTVTFHENPIVWINLKDGKLMRTNTAFIQATKKLAAIHRPSIKIF